MMDNVIIGKYMMMGPNFIFFKSFSSTMLSNEKNVVMG
jgi:hypothetical protein